MPDVFELAHSCLKPFQADAGGDPDFDTKPNLLEYAKGTNPCSGDTDGDSVPDNLDPCRLLAEDFDGFQDADGCPDYDNDKDGLCDGHFAPGPPGPVACTIPLLPAPRYVPAYPGGAAPDRCANVPEDFDAFKDLDGCPEPDNDNDGLPDVIDACPATDYTAGPDGIADTGDEPHDVFGVPIQTREDYDSILDWDGCHDSPGDDYDGDGLTDEDEALIYATNPAVADTDGDTCADGAELGPKERLGGRRDPNNRWDFYDVDGNGLIDLFRDIFTVAYAFGQGPGGPLYRPALDRSPPLAGGDPWDMQAPDGVIDLFTDIFGVAFQFGHDCT